MSKSIDQIIDKTRYEKRYKHNLSPGAKFKIHMTLWYSLKTSDDRLRKSWEAEKKLFPIRYHSSKTPLKCLKWSSEIISQVVVGLSKPKRLIQIGKSKEQNFKQYKNISVFPLEIWYLIIKFSADKVSLMRVSKAFLNEIASQIYSTIHLTVAVSTLTKMKLNDECFLKNGPDLMSVEVDSYKIYERSKTSKSYDYEVLDTNISNDFHCQSYDPKLHYGEKSYREDKVIEIRSYKKVKHILNNIIKNPNSIMKKYIKEAFVDICIMDGAERFIDDDSTTKLSKLLKTQEKREECSLLKYNLKSFEVLPFDDNFERPRWEDTYDLAQRIGDFVIEHGNRFRTRNVLDVFPTNVYFKELMLIHILSPKFYSHDLRRRISHCNLNDNNVFRSFNPVAHWLVAADSQMQRDDISSVFSSVLSAQLSVNIQNRQFETEQVIDDFLYDLVEAFTSDIYCPGIQSSVLIAGINDSKPQLSMEFTRETFYQERTYVDDMLTFKPNMVLINKHSADGNSTR